MSKSRILVGTRKGLFSFDRGPSGWNRTNAAHAGVPITYAAEDARTGTTWACIDHGHWGQKLSRSKDRGESWEEIAAPVYPEGAIMNKPHSLPESAPATMPAKLELIWVLAAGGADQPGRLYLGTNPGALFRSDDDGASWQIVTSLWNHEDRMKGWFGGGRDTPGIHSIIVDPRDSKRVLIGISCGGVYETSDDGVTWERRNKGMRADFLPDPTSEVGQDPHFVALCPTAPDTVWTQHHCGIFVSTDGTASWTEVTEENGPAGFGFPVAVDENDPETAWVVPGVSDAMRIAVDGALCVCRTEDGGKSWTALRDGLPQTDAYDVVFRHALDLSGDTLVFGSTTGNLYLSENRGESWNCLGNNLPPVYSVRFAE